jgi:hypothetical protein
MVEGEILSPPDADMNLAGEVYPVLDSYLRKVGIVSAEIRSRWVAHVLSGLQMHIGEFSADDIVEQAVERMRDALDVRLARVANLDPINERREIAGIWVVLLEDRYADLMNALFDDSDVVVDPQLRDQLRTAIAADRPRPVREDAPLDMPLQTIELRHLNPLRWLFRASR